MNKQVFIGLIVAIVVFIVGVFNVAGRTFGDISVFLIIPAVWIYLVWMVWKKKTDIFHDQVEPESAERRLKWLKIFLLVAGISGVVVIGFSLYTKYFIPPDWEESDVLVHIVFFSVPLFIIANIGGLVILLGGQRKTT